MSYEFLKKLDELESVGYKRDEIKSMKDYCQDQEFEEEAVIDDLEDITDSSIIEHLESLYQWDDKKKRGFC